MLLHYQIHILNDQFVTSSHTIGQYIYSHTTTSLCCVWNKVAITNSIWIFKWQSCTSILNPMKIPPPHACIGVISSSNASFPVTLTPFMLTVYCYWYSQGRLWKEHQKLCSVAVRIHTTKLYSVVGCSSSGHHWDTSSSAKTKVFTGIDSWPIWIKDVMMYGAEPVSTHSQ